MGSITFWVGIAMMFGSIKIDQWTNQSNKVWPLISFFGLVTVICSLIF